MCQLLFQLKIPPHRRQTIEGEDAEITYFSQARQWPLWVLVVSKRAVNFRRDRKAACLQFHWRL